MNLHYGLGWHPDLPDPRDLKVDDKSVKHLWAQIGRNGHSRKKRANDYDLRQHFIEDIPDQGGLAASSAFASAALVEYFQCRVCESSMPLSKLFLYQTANRLAGQQSAGSLDLRTTLKAIVRFGIPQEKFWPATDASGRNAPTDPFLYGFADRFSELRFVRVDAPRGSGSKTLDRVKDLLAAGFPSVFGFAVPASMRPDGVVPWRSKFEVSGGQAVVAVGYDDKRPGKAKGALLFRNSWGADWGSAVTVGYRTALSNGVGR